MYVDTGLALWIELNLLFLTWSSIQLTNTIQKKLNVSSTQLLYQSAPFQAAILFVSGPLVDQCLTKQNVFAYKYSPLVLVHHITALSFPFFIHAYTYRKYLYLLYIIHTITIKICDDKLDVNMYMCRDSLYFRA